MACTHLDLEEEPRLASVPLIVEEAQLWQKPFILAGDWNDTPESELLQEMEKYFNILSNNEPSFPADEPQDCLDYVALFKGHSAEMLESYVINEPEASDHRPVVVRLELR